MEQNIGNTNSKARARSPLKMISYGILFLTGTLLVIDWFTGIFHSSGISPQKLKVISSTVLLVSLLLITLANERKDDEMAQLIRLKSIRTAFYAGLLYIIVMQVISVIKGSATLTPFGMDMVIGILLVYHVAFNIQKQRLL